LPYSSWYRKLVARVESKSKIRLAAAKKSRDQNSKNHGLGRNFRRIIDAEVRLNDLERALAKATELTERWKIICASSREFGFFGVRMSVNGIALDDFPVQAPGPCWQLRIALADSNYINFFRSCDEEMNSVILGAFVSAVERGLRDLPSSDGQSPFSPPKRAQPTPQSAGGFALPSIFRAIFRSRRPPRTVPSH
jgi:hypothetical protein